MNPTPKPDALATPQHNTRDEALGQKLDEYLKAICCGSVSPAPSDDPELASLQPVVDRLHQLAEGINAPVTADWRTTDPIPSTTDSPQARIDTSDGLRKTPETPTHIGKFQVIRGLGRGGQATTFLAFDPDLKRQVVLKLYHAAHTAADKDRVLREGQALARVRSPYVAQCYSAERFQEIPYLVVEYIPGQTLTELAHACPPSPAEALAFIDQLAEGLAALHACGLLHRDIKPGNILVGDDGKPRLIDFGLAVPLGSDDLHAVSGTIAYMAPEQARGQADRIDLRTDVYGLGGVLYFLLTGQPPHMGRDARALLAAACNEDVVSVKQRRAEIPQALNDLCMRCLARDTAQRFASANELQAAVRRLRAAGSRRIALVAGLSAAVILVVIGSFAGLLAMINREPTSPGKPPELPPLVKHAGNEKKPEPAKPVVPEGKPIDNRLAGPLYVKGRQLRQDFSLKIEAIGSTYDARNDVHVIHVGERIIFKIEAEQDCHVGLWNVTASKVTQLFPNRSELDTRLRPGVLRQVPDAPGTHIKASKPTMGVEYIHVVASVAPLREIEIPALRAGPFDVYQGPEAFDRCTVALRDFELVEASKAISEVVLRFQILP